jgi:hypothetical protein
MVVGGLGDAKQIDDHSRNAAHAVKAAAEQKTGKTFDTYEPVQYKSQVVAGTNYFVKVHVGNDEYLHLRYSFRFYSKPLESTKICPKTTNFPMFKNQSPRMTRLFTFK